MKKPLLLLATILFLVGTPVNPVFAAASFRGVAGSYAASNEHLGGGVETLTNWTMEMWVRPARVYTNFGLLDIHGNWKQTTIHMDQGGRIGCLTMWPNTFYHTFSDFGVITANEWQLLGFVSDGATLSIYRNGVMVTNGPVSPQVFIRGEIAGSVTGVFNFGLDDLQTLTDRNFYDGAMSDFRLWDRALTPTELSNHLLSHPSASAPGLLNWIPFDETSGTTWHDIVNGVAGTYYNVDLVAGPVVPQPRVGLIQAVKPTFSHLILTTNYQMQVSEDMSSWTNYGSPFTATSTNMIWSEYFEVGNWNSLFFRLELAP